MYSFMLHLPGYQPDTQLDSYTFLTWMEFLRKDLEARERQRQAAQFRAEQTAKNMQRIQRGRRR